MEQNYLAIQNFIMFGFNYHEPKEFCKYIADKVGRPWMASWLEEKFSDCYQSYGSHAVMPVFFTELDSGCRNALIDYALKEYAPQGMCLNDEQKKLLGI